MVGKRTSRGPSEGRGRTNGSAPVARRSSRSVSASALGKYKLLALDLDGTVLNHAGAANDADVAAVRKLRARGVKVTILTGRLYSGTREAAELLGIEGPVGCADGSHIVNVKNDKTLLHHGIRGRAADRLRASLERNDLVAFLFAEDAIVHDERGADYLPYVRTWSTDLRYAHRVTEHALWDSDEGMTAVVALGKEASIGRTVADIQRDSTEAMQVAMFPFRRDPEHWGMVARASGGTKGTALAWMSKHYGIDISETVCVGDWLNDLPMMSCAGRSFAMGQAPAEVKAAATDVLEGTIDAGGAIAEAIGRAFGTKA
ncbi:MAG: HAD hydrolase family protein [Labilithrix sp.]|nr:HAD hydrolase family protein [Labilithrix sp.]